MTRPVWWVLSALALAGCMATPRKLQVDNASLQPDPGALSRPGCAWHLLGVEDRRDSDAAGGLGVTDVSIQDAPAMLASLMARAGITANGEGRGVTLRLHRLYMRQNLDVKVPTAVIEVLPQGGAAFVVRSQAPSVAWSYSDDAMREGFSRIMLQSVNQVTAGLDQRCP